MRQKKFTESVGIRCRKSDLDGIDKVCAALGITRSTFLRDLIENILTTINLNKNDSTRIS